MEREFLVMWCCRLLNFMGGNVGMFVFVGLIKYVTWCFWDIMEPYRWTKLIVL